MAKKKKSEFTKEKNVQQLKYLTLYKNHFRFFTKISLN